MDTGGGERWMTYAEIADMRGCSRAAAERWTQRQKLRRQPGNDGKTRVLVAPATVEPSQPRKTPRMDPADIAPALAAFEQALTDIREAHAGETSTLREQLEKARAEAAEQRIEAEQARAEVREAQGEAEQLRQADAARKARGRLARLRQAWRGQ